MKKHLNMLRNEAESTIRVLFLLQKYNDLLTNQEYVNIVNKNVYFWRIFESSLNTKLLIGIRRLFESKKEAFNFQTFIMACKNNISQFSLASFEQRRTADSPMSKPLWLDEYLKSVYTPTDEDFNQLSKLVRENSKKMKGVYTDAASKIFAHAIATEKEMVRNILSQIRFDEMELALNALWHVYEQVWQMYENGRKPSLEVSPYPHKEEICESLVKQLTMTAS